MDPTQISKWRAVFHVFGSEYWLRVWIMHEVVCARHVIIRSGEHTFRWLDIGRMALIICFFSSVVSAILELTTAASWTAATVGNLISLHQRRNMVVNADGEPLLGLLTAARRHKSTDWRDRVYSLLRISDITMNVDYNFDANSVVVEATRTIILRSKRLDVICETWSPQFRGELPSWCPNWSELHTHGVEPFGVDRKQASGEIPPGALLSFSEDGKILSCTGHCLGTVTAMGGRYFEPDYYANRFSDAKKKFILDWLTLATHDRPQAAQKRGMGGTSG
jgi:hypothetical protein